MIRQYDHDIIILYHDEYIYIYIYLFIYMYIYIYVHMITYVSSYTVMIILYYITLYYIILYYNIIHYVPSCPISPPQGTY